MSSEDVMWKQAAEQIARLQEENARLRAALQPLADINPQQENNHYFVGAPDGEAVSVSGAIIYIKGWNWLTVGHLRAAAKALNDGQ